MRRIILLLCLIAIALTAISCSSSSSDDSGATPVAPTTCGTIVNGKYKNPVADSDGEIVFFVSASASNLIIVQRQDGQDILVRLLGITDEPRSRLTAAKSIISSFASDGLLFVPAGCTDGAASNAIVGSVFNRAGENLAELLVTGGVASANTVDICGGNQIAQCLVTISNSDPINSGPLSTFLWKPVSDSDENLAIHSGPFGTTVLVNGVAGQNQGPGNGFGSLARFPRPGCAYGGARVEVLDSDGLPYTVGGRTSFTIPSPCGRHCATDGNAVVACVKN